MPGFVDAEALILALCPDDVDSGTQQPANMPLPFIIVRKVDGASADARFIDAASIRIDVTASSRDEAYTIANEVRSALWEAWEQQTVTPHGHVTWLEEQQSPAQFNAATDYDGAWAFRAIYDVTVRRG